MKYEEIYLNDYQTMEERKLGLKNISIFTIPKDFTNHWSMILRMKYTIRPFQIIMRL